jgi:hypothetical protein
MVHYIFIIIRHTKNERDQLEVAPTACHAQAKRSASRTPRIADQPLHLPSVSDVPAERGGSGFSTSPRPLASRRALTMKIPNDTSSVRII